MSLKFCPVRSAALALCLASASVSWGQQGASLPRLHADGSYFKDESGRVVLLRGVNATGDAKVPPFTGIRSSEELVSLSKWGLNLVRLLFNWEAFEPQPGQYNDAYLAQFEQVVRWAGAQGIYVLVDFHQDAFSRYSVSGCGEGFPAWAIAPDIARKTPDNGDACKNWGVMMIVDLTHHATWNRFHSDKYGARSRYVAMVAKVAQQMAAYPQVLGYDVINEPWGSSTELLRLYEKAGQAIRAQDPQAVLFFPPHALLSSGIGSDPIPRPSFDNAAYSPHFYDPTVITFGGWWGGAPSGALDPMLRKAQSRQSPMLLGEFGAPYGESRNAEYLEALYGWLDANFVSAAQWSYTPSWTEASKDGWNMEDFSIVAQGQLRTSLFVPRPYPQVTAGTPVVFQRTSHGLIYRWAHKAAAGETVLYVPDGYLQGRTISTQPALLQCQSGGQTLRCTASQDGVVQVTIN